MDRCMLTDMYARTAVEGPAMSMCNQSPVKSAQEAATQVKLCPYIQGEQSHIRPTLADVGLDEVARAATLRIHSILNAVLHVRNFALEFIPAVWRWQHVCLYYIYIGVCMYMYVCMCVCVYIYIYIGVCMCTFGVGMIVRISLYLG